MENCANDMVLDPSMFSVNPKPMRFIPQRCIEVNPFGNFLREWARMPLSVTQPVLSLLNGKPMVCHGNRVVAIVRDGSPDCANKSDDELVKLWFTENPNFGVAVCPKGIGISARIVPDSVRLVESKVCIEKKWKEKGFYRKLTIEFDTVFRCWEQVEDLSEAELAKSFVVQQFNVTPRDNKKWLRALKAVLMYPGQVYIGEGELFIMRMPRNVEDGIKLLTCSLDLRYLPKVSALGQYGKDFSPSAEQRQVLNENFESFYFNNVDGQCICRRLVGNLAHEGFWQLIIRIPFVEPHPKLFVRNVRKGVAQCTEFIDGCTSQDRFETCMIKCGCFEFKMQKSLRAWEFYTPFPSRAQMTMSNAAGPQWSESEMLYAVHCEIEKMRAYFTALADFVELLLDGTDDIATIRKNLATLVASKIQLDPMSYVEYCEPVIREFASYCISGEWVSAVGETPDLPF